MMNTAQRDVAALRSETAATVAANWFVRLQNDDLSVEEIAQWQQWLAASEENRKSFEGMQELWEQLENLPDRRAPQLPVGRSRQSAWRFAAAASLAGLVLALGFGGWRLWQMNERFELNYFQAETALGEHKEVALPDGSQLALGALSSARVRFAAREREVNLDRGEAFFEVAKDAERPFIVRAGDTIIRAVGTAFNVRRSGERVEVSVTEGAVDVTSRRGSPTGQPVKAGQEVVVDREIESTSIRKTPPSSAISWRTGRLEYLGEPLKYVVEDVNRYSREKISIDDPTVAELHLSGTVLESDIDGWLSSLEQLLPVTVERTPEGRVIQARR
jgi:transmembrane sensor